MTYTGVRHEHYRKKISISSFFSRVDKGVYIVGLDARLGYLYITTLSGNVFVRLHRTFSDSTETVW